MVVQLVPNKDELKHKVLSCFSFQPKFENDKTKKSCDGSNPVIRQREAKGNDDKEKKDETSQQKSKIKDKKNEILKEKQHVS